MAKRKRRTPAEMELARKSQGLGDTIEKITEATGIKTLVKFIAGEDCGCEERKAKLNIMFPSAKPKCLEEREYLFLNEFFKENKNQIKPTEQLRLLSIFNRVFSQRQEPSSCKSCVIDIVNKLRKVYEKY
jgi:hypothetical protein